MAAAKQAKLFDQMSSDTSGYSAKDIEVLEGLEPVRKRPGMYIGGTDERAYHHLFAEVLDNSMDEAVAGHANRIEIRLDADGYLTVIDKDRMAVSLIYSIFHGFGSGMASDRYGIAFQNRGAGFSLEQGHPNEAAGGKRPMHTIIPAMLRRNGRVTMPFGVMGGAYQPCGHARIVSNLVDFGMDLQTALDAPRAFAGLFSGHDGLALETGYAPAVFDALAAKGHTLRWSDEPLGGAQAIHLDDSGILIGASDPRKDGCALGY